MKIEQVWKDLEADLAAVEQCLSENLQSRAPLISEVGFHILRGGGKRIRPLLLLLAAKACGYRGTRHYLLGSIVEYIHTASLLHDDVIDEASIRRGQASANRVFGNQASILVGDFLYSKALYLAVREENQEIMDVLSDATTIMSEGEVMQLASIGNLDLTEAEYLTVVTHKTAVLISAACHLGAILADAPASQKKALVQFGLDIGVAFQLIDDALDYAAQEGKLGKRIGKDLMEGKVTLPIIHLLRHSPAAEKSRIRRIFENGPPPAEDAAFVQECIARHGSIPYTLQQAETHVQAAKGQLGPINDSPAKDALFAVSDYISRRER